jgi:hypothetical protein
MALVGNTFYQSSALDPGTGYAMYYWNQTDTGLVYIRNASDTAWVLVGNANQIYLGQLSTQGGVMNGAITGAHGLAPATSNDFSGSLRQGGIDVALKTYVDAQIAAVNAAIGTSVASALSSVTTLNLAAKTTKMRGVWNVTGTSTGNTIPLPSYSDGVPATEAECIWGAYWSQITGGYYTSDNFVFTITETSNRVYSLVAQKQTSIVNFTGQVSWFIIGFRSS